MADTAHTPSVSQAKEEKPAADVRAGKNKLGLNRWIYAAGYSAKDGYLYGALSFIGTAATLYAGEKFNIKGIQWVTGRLKAAHKRWENVKGGFGLQGPVFILAGLISFVVGHVMVAPSGRTGLKKAEDMIRRYDDAVAEKEELVASTQLLMKDKARLETELDKLQRSRAPYADKVRSEAATVPGVSA